MLAGWFDLLWPRICPVCEFEMTGPAGPVHRACLRSLPAARAPGQGAVPVCARFEDGPGWFSLLHAWKYGGQRGIAAEVGRSMADRAPRWPGGPMVLVPMPDDPRRRLERGYSPVFDLAREIAARTGAALDAALLTRPGSVPSQTTCPDDAARERNVRHVLRTGDLSRRDRGALLVLVEDQVTSGASVRAAVRLLRARGHRVAVWCAARAARAPTGLA